MAARNHCPDRVDAAQLAKFEQLHCNYAYPGMCQGPQVTAESNEKPMAPPRGIGIKISARCLSAGWLLSLAACASVPAGPDQANCPIVPMQGNGGTADRCRALPIGCSCQQM
jgi:hypothetical protein